MPFTPEEIENKQFLIGLRGYDRMEVDSFLRAVAADMRDLLEQASRKPEAPAPAVEPAPVAEAVPEVVEEAPQPEAPAPEPEPVDNFAHFGETMAAILRDAENTVADMRAKAEEEAREMISGAEARSVQIVSEAQSKADELVDRARDRAAELRASAQSDADNILGHVRHAGSSFRGLLDNMLAGAGGLQSAADELRRRLYDTQGLLTTALADLGVDGGGDGGGGGNSEVA